MKVIFMGTPDFSVGTLEALIGAGHEVVLVVTQPDKPKGRGGKMQYTPVKEAAVAHGIPVFQPVKIREPEAVEELRKYNADIMVVIAFGQILPKEILDMTPYGCINVHASLLPSYRGAAPIQWAVINGDKVSGVTTMQMNEGLDTGDMIMKTEVPLSEDETGGSLHDKLAEAGAKLCVETLKALEDKTATWEVQGESPTELICAETCLILSMMRPFRSQKIMLLCFPMISMISFFLHKSPISSRCSISRWMIRSSDGWETAVIRPPPICLRRSMQNPGAVIGLGLFSLVK